MNEFRFDTFEQAFEFLTSEETGLGLKPERAARALASAHCNKGQATWYESSDFPIREVHCSPMSLRDYVITL